jgi:hypothetical protein
MSLITIDLLLSSWSIKTVYELMKNSYISRITRLIETFQYLKMTKL